MRVAFALVSFLAVTAWPIPSRATPSAKLVYVREPAARACPGESDLRKAVASRIGYDPFFPTASKTVIAQISRAATGYRGKVQIVGDDGNLRGSRDLSTRGDDCSELLSALALAISIALDDLDDGKPPPTSASGQAAETTPPAAPAPEPSPPPQVEPLREAPRVAAPPAQPARALGLLLGAGPTTSFAFAPSPSIGASLAGTLRYSLLAARFGLRADLPAGGDLAGGGRVMASSVLASVSGCIRGDVPFVCAGAGVGSFATTTAGVHTPASDTALLTAVVFSGGVDIPFWRQLYVEPFVEGDVVLTRHRVLVDGVDSYQLPGFAGTGGIHLGWRFL